MRPPRAARLTVGFDSRATWASSVNERPCSAHACASESGFSLRRRPPEVFAVPQRLATATSARSRRDSSLAGCPPKCHDQGLLTGSQEARNIWSRGLFGALTSSTGDVLFTKQPLCQLSYAGILHRRLAQGDSLEGPGRIVDRLECAQARAALITELR